MLVLETLLAALLVLGPLIAIHEFGHFAMARLLGVKVLTFSIGFGRGFVKWYDKQGTCYQITAFPFGGFVKMVNEQEGEVAAADLPYAFNRQPVWKRFAIVAAGPGINLLLGLLLAWVVLLPGVDSVPVKLGSVLPNGPLAQSGFRAGDQIIAVDHKPADEFADVYGALLKRIGDSGEIVLTVRHAEGGEVTAAVPVQDYLRQPGADPFKTLGLSLYVPPFSPVLKQVLPGGPGERQGLRAGDRILSVNGVAATTWDDVVAAIGPRAGQRLAMRVHHADGRVAELAVVPEAQRDTSGAEVGRLGIELDPAYPLTPAGYVRHIAYTPGQAFGKALDSTWNMMVMIPVSIWRMVNGHISVQNLSGPIGIAKVAKENLDLGLLALLQFMAFYSVNLGVLNLLPVPVLDGGHLVYFSVEAVLRRPVSQQLQAVGAMLGVALLGALTLFVIVNDLSRLL